MTTSQIDIYKKAFAYTPTVLQKYANGTCKVVWYEKYSNRKICLSSAHTVGKNYTTLFSKTNLAITDDELENLISYLRTANPQDKNLYYVVSEGEDYMRQKTKLVVETSEYGGLMLSRYVCKNTFLNSDENELKEDCQDPDPDPYNPDENTKAADGSHYWVQNFEKFYFSAKDNWKEFAKKLRNFLQIAASNVVAIDDDDDDNDDESQPPP